MSGNILLISHDLLGFWMGPGKQKNYGPEKRLWRDQADRQLLRFFSIGTKGYIELDTSRYRCESSFQGFWDGTRQQNVWTRKPTRRIRPNHQLVGFFFYWNTKDILELDWLQMTFLVHIIPRSWEWDQATNIWTRKADLEVTKDTQLWCFNWRPRLHRDWIGKFDWSFQDFWEYDPK